MQSLDATTMGLQATMEATPDGHLAQTLMSMTWDLGTFLLVFFPLSTRLFPPSPSCFSHNSTRACRRRISHAQSKQAPVFMTTSSMLAKLGNHLSNRYKRTRNIEDLEGAIAQLGMAVETIPDHSARALMLGSLGGHLSSRYEQTRNLQGLEAVLAARIASWCHITAPILTRIQAALSAARMLTFSPLAKDLSRACLLLYDTVSPLPATSRSLEQVDRQYIPGNFTDLLSLCTSVLLEAGKSPLEALRLHELGHSYITNGRCLDHSQAQSDISNLMEHHPMLAEEFDSLRQELDSRVPMLSLGMSIEQHLRTQRSPTYQLKHYSKHQLQAIYSPQKG